MFNTYYYLFQFYKLYKIEKHINKVVYITTYTNKDGKLQDLQY